MSYNSVNASKSIVWVDGSGNTHNITKVVYSDNNSSIHPIWPCNAELTNVYITELKSGNGSNDIHHAYSLSNGEPNYCLKPETLYAITGTIVFYKESGVILKTVTDCYFFPETQTVLEQNAPVGIYESPNVATYGDRLPSDGSGTAIHQHWDTYGEWTADDTVGHVSPLSVQVGWFGNDTYTQNGFLFDSNYTTPFILKRADITQQLMLSKISGTPSSTADVVSTPVTLQSGESITFWPKFKKTATDTNWGSWNKYTDVTLTTNDFTYDSSTIQVINNQDGSWTVKPLIVTNGISNVVVSSGNYSFTLGVICIPNTTYDLRSQGSSVLGTTVSNVTTPLSIIIWDTSNNAEYTGNNYTLHTNDSSVVTINNKTIVPNLNNNGNTATIWAEVEGVATGSFTVEVGNVVTYYSIQDTSSSATPTYNIVGNTITLSASTNYNYSVRFFGDNQGNYERIPYYESVSGGRPIMVQPQGTNGSMLVTVLGTATSGTTLNVPLYFDNAMTSGTEFTTLVITVS